MVSSAKKLRKHLLEENTLHEVINLIGFSFQGVNVETIIISCRKENTNKQNNVNILISNENNFQFSHKKEQSLFMLNEGFELNVFSGIESEQIIQKMFLQSEKLDNLALIKAGLQAYEFGKGNPKQSLEDVKSRPYDYSYKFDENTFEYLDGKDVKRYAIDWSGTFLKYGENLAAPRTFSIFSGKKIIIREITGIHPKSIIATYTDQTYLFNRSNIAIIENENFSTSLKFILGILNSKLIRTFAF